MVSVSCIVVGRDVAVVSTLEEYIQRMVGIRIEATFTDSNAALNFIDGHKPALMLLDSQMPSVSSANFLSLIKDMPAVVLIGETTERFPVGVNAAILGVVEKPVLFETLVETVQRVTEWLQHHSLAVSPEYLFLKENRKMVRVTLRSILYVECFKDYLVIHCSEKDVRVRLPMSTLENRLDKNAFVRIHKSYLVAIDKIESFSTMLVELKGIELPVGRSYQKTMLLVLNEHFCLL